MTQRDYLTSNLGRARASIASSVELADKVQNRLEELATAITVGNGTKCARERLAGALLDLRVMVADVDAFVRLAESE